MKQINFNNPGGFPLEQETLERIQIAFREELYEAFKSLLGISTQKNYIIAKPESVGKLGWLIIHQLVTDFEGTPDSITNVLPQKLEGILYPFLHNPTPTSYIKTTRTVSKLVFGDGSAKEVYVDYKAEYITQVEYNTFGNSPKTVEVNGTTNTTTVYDISTFIQLATLPELASKFLPLAGFVPMQGNLNLGEYMLSKLDTMPEVEASVRSQKLKLGHPDRRGLITGANYLATALEDSSASGQTSLTLNPNAEWNTTEIGGNVKLAQVVETTFDATKQSLVIDNNGYVTKTKDIFSNQIQSLIDRIVLLEARPLGNIPVGMVAIWGKPANEIPSGWVEYVDLRGRMPIGLDPSYTQGLDRTDYNLKTLGYAGGTREHKLSIEEMPNHNHTISNQSNSQGGWGKVAVGWDGPEGNDPYTDYKGGDKAHTNMSPYRVVHFIQFIGDISNNAAPIINSIRRTDTNALVTTAPIDLNFTGTSANLNFLATVNDPEGFNSSLLFNWEFISGPAALGDWFSGTRQINLDNSVSIPLSIIGMSATTAANPYKFKFTVTDNFGAKTEQIITINVTRQAGITNYSVVPAEGNNSSSRNYVTRVTGTPGEIVNIKASISDFTNLAGVGGYTTGDMIVKLNGFNGDLVKTFSVSNQTTDFSSFVHNFNITIGQSGVTDIYTSMSVSEALIASNLTEDLYLNLNGQLEIESSGQAVYMHAEYVYTYTGGGSCFDTESLITMASGQSKKLKNVVAGDKLAALNFPNLIDESQSNYLDWKGKLTEASKAEVTVVGKTTHTVNEYYEIVLIDNSVIKVTEAHPLLVTQDDENVSWVKVRNIKQDMKLVDKNGTPKAITSITLKNETLEVALLDVEEIDDYIVSGIVAHNIPIEQKN